MPSPSDNRDVLYVLDETVGRRPFQVFLKAVETEVTCKYMNLWLGESPRHDLSQRLSPNATPFIVRLFRLYGKIADGVERLYTHGSVHYFLALSIKYNNPWSVNYRKHHIISLRPFFRGSAGVGINQTVIISSRTIAFCGEPKSNTTADHFS